MSRIFSIVAVAAALGPVLGAQTPDTISIQDNGPNIIYKQEIRQGVAQTVAGVITTQMMVASAVTGSPFSATQQQHSLQTLGDGTRIERTETSLISRDSQGRTRTEAPHAAGEPASFITIQDPVARSNVMLNVADKTADQMPLPSAIPALPMPPPSSAAGAGAASMQPRTLVSVSGESGQTVVRSGRMIAGAVASPANIVVAEAQPNGVRPTTEDLGTQDINGVLAKGTRTTLTIPAGQIGNDRPIQIVNERWYSDDLQMVVKSSNSDPRFGTNEFELTGINRVEPDPSLFQIPADFTVTRSPKAAFFSGQQPGPKQ